MALTPWLGERLPTVILVPTLVIAVWLGGVRVAWIPAIFGYLATMMALGGRGHFSAVSDSELVEFAAYSVPAASIIWIGEAMRRAKMLARETQELLRITLAGIGDAEKALQEGEAGHRFLAPLTMFKATESVLEPAAPVHFEETGGGKPSALSALKVLVADDNPDVSEALSHLLEILGSDVDTATDGEDAVAMAERLRPELILMDVGMPKLNGLGATRQIRAQPWGNSPVIVALTGWGREQDLVESIAAGCDGHLVKPVTLDELEAMVTTLRDAGRFSKV